MDDTRQPGAASAAEPRGSAAPEVSIVVPVYNERDNLRPLLDAIQAAVAEIGRGTEIIFVNDGSTDGSGEALAELAAEPGVVVISFRRNYGQTAALMAGFDHARGEVVVPMDADLQNDPADIAALLDRLDEGYDLVSGWRADRKDNALSRTLPSRIANYLISRISGLHLHDYGCTLKAYRRSALDGVNLYGEMHRFVPIFVSWNGGRVCELPVRHHPRKFGHSKYGLTRVIKVILELIVIKFLADYHARPIHVFGTVGLLFLAASLLSGLWAVYLRVFEGTSFIQTPLPILTSMTFMMGVVCLLMGILAELLVRVYFESQQKRPYTIKSKIGAGAADD